MGGTLDVGLCAETSDDVDTVRSAVVGPLIKLSRRSIADAGDGIPLPTGTGCTVGVASSPLGFAGSEVDVLGNDDVGLQDGKKRGNI